MAIIISGGYRNTNPKMPSRLSALTDAVNEWFQIHGKVIFTFGVFNVPLIVFCSPQLKALVPIALMLGTDVSTAKEELVTCGAAFPAASDTSAVIVYD